MRLDQRLAGKGSKTVAKNKLHKVVWFKAYPDMETALVVEHRLKRKSRARKLPIIEASNPDMRDLSAEWLREAAATFD